jgi:RES domain-containing protein
VIIQAWRLVREARAADAFTGEGARLYGGRWNPAGTRTTYLSATRSLAALEVLVHQADRVPAGQFLFFDVEFPQDLITTITLDDLPADWQRFPPQKSTVDMGKTWITAKKSPVLQVPSILIPEESNYLLNFDHPHASKIEVGKPRIFSFDPRLLKTVRKK